MSDKTRIIELQRQNKLFRDALTRIKSGRSDPEGIAEETLYSSMTLDRKFPLQGVVGHERRKNK